MTVNTHRIEEGDLALEVAEGPTELRVTWHGRSAERDPARFLAPALGQLLAQVRASGRRLVLDFAALEYMNSSTFLPLVKALDEARRTRVPVALEYSLARKWQALSFSALRTFETPDGLISVHGR